MSISAVVITLDEGRNIEACLESVRFCDEVVVLDSGSRDDTVERAKKWADRVEHHPFRDFADQKNRAIELATGEWVLSIDADERVPVDLRDEILMAIQGSESGFRIARLSNFFGHWLRHGGFYPDRQLRLFRREGSRFRGVVHERVELEGRVGDLVEPLIHYPYESIDEWLDTINRHTTLGARRVAAGGARPSLRRAFTTPAYLFARRMIKDRAWKDGVPGVLAAGISSFGGFLVHAKHWAMERRSQEVASGVRSDAR